MGQRNVDEPEELFLSLNIPIAATRAFTTEGWLHIFLGNRSSSFSAYSASPSFNQHSAVLIRNA